MKKKTEKFRGSKKQQRLFFFEFFRFLSFVSQRIDH